MLKRSVFASAALAFFLSGCATVSVMPTTSTVKASMTAEQSDLRQAALSFSQTAVSRGWISQSRGFMDIASVLIDGKSIEADDNKKSTYAGLIGADMRAAAEVEATLIADANDAALALAAVSKQADAFLASRVDAQVRTVRADLVCFERTLVQAQQTRRAFIIAAEIAQLDNTGHLQAVFARLDSEIDKARTLADRLATEYSRRETVASVS